MWWSKESGARLLLAVDHERRRGSGHELKEIQIHLIIRKKCFILSPVKHWNRLSRDVMDPSSFVIKM